MLWSRDEATNIITIPFTSAASLATAESRRLLNGQVVHGYASLLSSLTALLTAASPNSLPLSTHGVFILAPLSPTTTTCTLTYTITPPLVGSYYPYSHLLKPLLRTAKSMQHHFTRAVGGRNGVDKEICTYLGASDENNESVGGPPLLSELDPDAKARVKLAMGLELKGLTIKKHSTLPTLMALYAKQTDVWRPLNSPHPLMRHYIYVPPSNTMLGWNSDQSFLTRSSVVIDCEPGVAYSYYARFGMPGKVLKAVRDRQPYVMVAGSDGEHDVTFATVHEATPMRPREFVSRCFGWRDEQGRVGFGSVPSDAQPDYGGRIFNAVKARAWSYVLFSPTGVNQCECKVWQRVESGGRIPGWVLRWKVGKYNSYSLEFLRQVFQRDDEIDAASRNLVEARLSNPNDISPLDDAFVSSAFDRLCVYNDDDFRRLDIKPTGGFQPPDMADWMGMLYQPGHSSVLARGVVTVDTSIAATAAYDLDKLSREFSSIHESKHTSEKEFKWMRPHVAGYKYNVVPPPPFLPREWILKIVWKWEDENTLVVAYDDLQPEEIDEFSLHFSGGEHRRAKATMFYKYEKVRRERRILL